MTNNLDAKRIEAFIESLTNQRNNALNTAASVNADLQVALIRIEEFEAKEAKEAKEQIAKKQPKQNKQHESHE